MMLNKNLMFFYHNNKEFNRICMIITKNLMYFHDYNEEFNRLLMIIKYFYRFQ